MDTDCLSLSLGNERTEVTETHIVAIKDLTITIFQLVKRFEKKYI